MIQQDTPTHVRRKRPILAMANEGRKVSGGSGRDASVGYEYENAAIHSPGQGKALNREPQAAHLEDQFVVHMPSAREPQPFAYPGYTAEQIETLEHYRCKARRVSSEGYDRRLFFHDRRPVAAVVDDSEHFIEAHSKCSRDPVTHHHHQHRPFTPYTTERFHGEPRSPEPNTSLMVRKRENNSKVSRILHHSHHQPRVDAQSSLEMPSILSGPRSPKRMSSTVQQRPVVHPNDPVVSRNFNKHAEKFSATAVGCGGGPKLHSVKPIGTSSPSRTSSTNTDDDDDGNKNVDQYIGRILSDDDERSGVVMHRIPGAGTDLSQLLPRVRLVKPEHAAVPRNTTEGKRQCSLGCGREREGDEQRSCTQRRVINNSTGTVVHSTTPPLFETTKETDDEGLRMRMRMNHTEQLLEYILLSVNYLGSLQLPQVGLIELLRDPNVSTKEKVEALKAILSLAGHALAVCTLLAMLCQLGTSLLQFFEVVLWPLAVPLRLLRWILIS